MIAGQMPASSHHRRRRRRAGPPLRAAVRARSPPRAPLTRERAGRRAGALARPSRLAGRWSRRPADRRRPAALGLHTVGDLLEHLPSDSREARTVAALRAGEQATVRGEVRSISARPVRRRGMRPLVEATRVRRHRHDARDVLQPAVARRALPARHASAAARQGRRARRLPRLPSRARRRARLPRPATESERAGGRALPGGGRHHLDADPHARARARDALRGRARAAAAALRAPRAPPRPRGGARRDALPARRREARGGPPPAGLRGAAARPARVPAPARAAPRSRSGAPALDGAPELTERWLARGAAVRAHRRPAASDRGDRRSIWREPRRCSGC